MHVPMFGAPQSTFHPPPLYDLTVMNNDVFLMFLLSHQWSSMARRKDIYQVLATNVSSLARRIICCLYVFRGLQAY